MRKYALLSSQGTACLETVLNEDEYCYSNRISTEHKFAIAKPVANLPDAPICGTWTDVTDNDAI